MTGMLLTGTGKGFLILFGGVLATDGVAGFNAGMTSEENRIFCFLLNTSVLICFALMTKPCKLHRMQGRA